jgi:hypothetical protein
VRMFRAVIGQQSKEAKLGAVFVVRCDKRALALAAHQQVVGGEFVDRFAHRSLADLVSGRQFDFTRNDLAGLPFAAFEALRYEPLDLLVQRTKSG